MKFPIVTLLLCTIYFGVANGMEEDYGCGNCTIDPIKDVMCFLKFGEENLKVTDQEDYVVIAGLSGRGKSFVTQFLGNDTSSLTISCRTPKECTIIDGAETVGGGAVSQTFLPNLVTGEDIFGKVTAFYDLPGFKDTRNECYEIAKSYYIAETMALQKRLKIIVVFREDDFGTGDRHSVKELFTQLSSLIKRPLEFEGGISFLINMADLEDEADQVDMCLHMLYKLSEFKGEVDALMGIHANSTHQFLDMILENSFTDDDSICWAKNMQYLPKAFKDNITDVNQLPIFLSSRGKVVDMVNENMTYVSKTREQFGIALTPEAVNLLVNVSNVIENDIVNMMKTLAADIEGGFVESFVGLAEEGLPDLKEFQMRCNLLIKEDYSFVEQEDLNPSDYIIKLIDTIQSFAPSEIEAYLPTLNETGQFLDFIQLSNPEINVDVAHWVQPLTGIVEKLKVTLTETTAPVVSGGAILRINSYSAELLALYTDRVNRIADGTESVSDSFIQQLNLLSTTSLSNCSGSQEGTFNCINEIRTMIEQQDESLRSAMLPHIDHLINFFNTTALLPMFPYIPPTQNWVTAAKSLFLTLSGSIIGHHSQQNNFIIDTMRNVTQRLRSVLETSLDSLVEGRLSDEDKEQLGNRTEKLKAIRFPDCDNATYPDAKKCWDEIQRNMQGLVQWEQDEALSLPKAVDFVNFCSVANVVRLDTRMWVPATRDVIFDLVEYISPKVPAFFDTIRVSIYTLSVSVYEKRIATINNLPSIDAKKSQMDGMWDGITRLENALSTSFNTANTKAEEFLETVDTELKTFSEGCPACENVKYVEETRVLSNLNEFNWRITGWMSNATGPIMTRYESDKTATAILTLLRSDYSNIATVHTGSPEMWAFLRRVQSITPSNVVELYTISQSLGFTATVQFTSDHFASLSQLNLNRITQLMNIAASDKDHCQGTCVNGQFVAFGNFVTMKSVIRCANKFQSCRTVAIAASHSLFMDDNFLRSSYGEQINNLVLLSGSMVSTWNATLNMNGVTATAVAGNGSSAGTICVVSDKISGSYTSLVNGGAGAKGGKGQIGGTGSKGATQAFNVGSSDCAAWSGRIRIRKHPNNCCEASCSEGSSCYTCGSGSEGVRVNIEGLSGTRGLKGGEGLKGGGGGSGGQRLEILLEEPLPRLANGTPGSRGAGGDGGDGGLGGLKGDTRRVHVDDYGGTGGYHCERRSSDSTVSSTERSSPGPVGDQGPLGDVAAPNVGVDISAYRSIFNQWKSQLEQIKTSEFFHEHATRLLERLGSHPTVPK